MSTVLTTTQDSSDPNRMQVAVAGLGFVTINRTHEGLIIDVHNLVDSDSIDSLAILNEEFESAEDEE